MFKNLEGARLGIFIFLGTVFMIISIFLLGNKEKLFSRTIEIRAYFNQIEGLKIGAPVRLSGYDIGSVSDISLSGDTTGRVEVRMRIETELKHFIRLDSRATVETEGLVGKKIVVISPGSEKSTEITENGIILSKNPINLSAIMDETQSIMNNINVISKDFSEIFSKINQGEGSVGKLVNDDKLYNSAVSVTQAADKSMTLITKRLDEIADIIVTTSGSLKTVVSNVDGVILDVKNLLGKVDKGEGLLGKIISDKKMADSITTLINNFVQTSEQTKKATTSLAENMEALKHNWLFKTYFEERGYWNKEEYENEINAKLDDLKKQNDILDKKIKELKDLEDKFDRSKAK